VEHRPVVSRCARTGNDDLDIYLSYEFPAREEGYKVYITSRWLASRETSFRDRVRGFRGRHYRFFAGFNLIALVLAVVKGREATQGRTYPYFTVK